MVKTLNDITNFSQKLVKVFDNSLSHLKRMSYFIQMHPSILELLSFLRFFSVMLA